MNSFYNPVKIIKTNNWLFELNKIAKENRMKEPIIVTSPGNRKRLNLDSEFDANFIFSEVNVNPDFDNCRKIIKFCNNKIIDSVIAIGGGSVLDLAKVAIAYLCVNKSDIYELISFKGEFNKKLTSIFLPTTHGSGSEVTMWGTVWNINEGKKYSIENSNLYPSIAILDGSLAYTLPLDISVITIMDSLSHCFEAIWNKNANNKSTEYAIKAISIILTNIDGLKKDPKNKYLRNKFLEASNTAGLAFSNTKTAAAHSLSYPLTINYGIPHGVASSISLIPLLEINKNYIYKELDIIYQQIETGYCGLIKMIKSIPDGILPYKLNKWGIKRDEVEFLTDNVFNTDRINNNIKNLCRQEVKDILLNIL